MLRAKPRSDQARQRQSTREAAEGVARAVCTSNWERVGAGDEGVSLAEVDGVGRGGVAVPELDLRDARDRQGQQERPGAGRQGRTAGRRRTLKFWIRRGKHDCHHLSRRILLLSPARVQDTSLIQPVLLYSALPFTRPRSVGTSAFFFPNLR